MDYSEHQALELLVKDQTQTHLSHSKIMLNVLWGSVLYVVLFSCLKLKTGLAEQQECGNVPLKVEPAKMQCVKHVQRQWKHISVVFLFTRFNHWFTLGKPITIHEKRNFCFSSVCFLVHVRSSTKVLFYACPRTSSSGAAFAFSPLDHTKRLVKGWTRLLRHFLFNFVSDGNFQTLQEK